jgi:hypothetical protein
MTLRGADVKRSIAIAGLALGLSLAALTVPTAANASCQDRKVAGTVLGGVGGALIGNSISRGGGGAILGGLGGAVLGHEVAGAGCHRYREARYYRRGVRYAGYPEAPPPPVGEPVRYVYYDQYGNPVSSGPVGAPPLAYAPQGPCRTETQDFYNDRAALVQRQIQVCGR